MASKITNGTATLESFNENGLPCWLDNAAINNAIESYFGEKGNIKSFSIENACQPDESYASLLLRLCVEVEFSEGLSKQASFVLKTQHNDESIAKVQNMFDLLQKEETMYHTILPKFEKLYEEAGKKVSFAPKAFKFDRDFGEHYVLLEDMRVQGYKTAHRINGLDLEHMQNALKKLAEFHAASACYAELFGAYSKEFTISIYNEKNRELLQKFNTSEAFLTQMKKWKNCEKYYEKLKNSDEHLVECLLKDQTFNPSEFNVLNHGDCWIENILFKYDAFGKVKDTLFIDFQVGKYGSPANDLFYLILSSGSADIKLSQFDSFVHYYYEHLIENLKLLKYQRPWPKLRNIYYTLFRNGLAAYMVVTKVLPIVLLDKDDKNFKNCEGDENKIKMFMYTNHKYVQAMTEILPWLDNRGFLDWN